MNNKDYPNTPSSIEVSIITVNYNGLADTCQMIESIHFHLRSVVYEIVVVDNNSKQDEISQIVKLYPFVRAVANSTNLGFAHGNNLGASVAQGKYLFFLNNDTYVTNDGIRFLIDRLESNPTIGGVSPMLRYTDEYKLVQFAGFTPLSRYTLRNRSIGKGKSVKAIYKIPKEIPYLHGAAMMVRREVYEKTGGIPTQYFLYYEELDWSVAIRRFGYTLWYEPACEVFHKESQSTGVQSPLKTFYMARNRFLFAYRNSSSWECFLTHLYLLFCVAVRDCVVYIAKKRFDLLKAMYAGISNYYSLSKEQKISSHGFHFSYFLP